jgi:hypothetical protein
MVTNWLHIHAVSTYNGLGLEIPRGDGTNGILEVDTGFPGGVALAPDAWREWKRAHAHAPLTLGWEYSPTDGGYVYEEAWANSLSVGPIIFNNVPIEESGPSGPEHLGSQYEGTIGLTALKGFWLVYDPAHAVVYMWRRKSTYSHYSYNRLGAVFNATSEQPDKLIARVVKDSPAYAAGVRDGDLLLQVDHMNVAPWGDSSRFALPAGTKLKLLLKRNGKTFETTATLSEILKPVEASN